MTQNNNPFIVSGPIPEKYFCDRKEETGLLNRYIENKENVVLISKRRMGKTKLIDHCINYTELGKHNIIIDVDILHTSSFREFIRVFGFAVFKTVAKRSSKMMKLFTTTMRSLQACFGFDPIQNSPTFDLKLGDILQPDYTLKEIFDVIEKAERHCLVVFDEFQQVSKYSDANAEAILRSHIQKVNNANFIFSGSQRRIMEEMFLSEKRPFYQNARTIHLQPIPLNIYEDFAVCQFQQENKDIEHKAVELTYNYFSGVTLYMQRIMKEAFSLTPVGECFDKKALENVIDTYISESATYIREQLSMISETQKELLYAIAKEEKPVKNITSSKFIKKNNLKSSSSVQAAIKKLLEYDLITRDEGAYSVTDTLMFQWLKKQNM